jgi:thiol-disulfide isomerase/thioredoxin
MIHPITIIKFTQSGCEPCLRMEPHLKQIQAEYAKLVTIREVDARTGDGYAEAVSHDVQGLPTLIFWANNRTMGRLTGYRDYNQIKAALTKALIS